jgi:replication-associated recombination protein RarA
MSYQVLARKWRPRSFASVVGQEHVVTARTHALEQQRLHHAYLRGIHVGHDQVRAAIPQFSAQVIANVTNSLDGYGKVRQ